VKPSGGCIGVTKTESKERERERCIKRDSVWFGKEEERDKRKEKDAIRVQSVRARENSHRREGRRAEGSVVIFQQCGAQNFNGLSRIREG